MTLRFSLTTSILLLTLLASCMKTPPTERAREWKYYDPSTNLISFANGTAQPAETVAARYRTTCDEDHGASCNRLASLYVAGIGVKRSKNKAHKLYKLACVLGEKRGCYTMDVGIDNYDPRYIPLMGDWCDKGDLGACEFLATAWETGDRAQHVPIDRRRALELYRKACQLESRASCDRVFELTQELERAD